MQEKLEFFSFLNTINNYFNLTKTKNIPEEFSYANHYGSKIVFDNQEDLEKQLQRLGYHQEDVKDLWFGEFEYVDEDEIEDEILTTHNKDEYTDISDVNNSES